MTASDSKSMSDLLSDKTFVSWEIDGRRFRYEVSTQEGLSGADALFDVSLIAPDYEPELTLAERYQAFRAANPHVLDAFEALTEQWLNAGHKRVGMKAVAERCRWEAGVRSSETDWRINNSYVSFIARDLVARRPEWADAIEFRQQKAVA